MNGWWDWWRRIKRREKRVGAVAVAKCLTPGHKLLSGEWKVGQSAIEIIA